MPKHLFVTGGVVSSLGKGPHLRVDRHASRETRPVGSACRSSTRIINVDPGTMSPYQHGEVYVLDDGSETDLDLGHYERFTSGPLTRDSQLHHAARSTCR